MNYSFSRRGFTVLEIVVLLIILLFLAAILFPIFGRGRDSHRPSCQTSLKIIGLGFNQYIQDYDERYPLVATGKSAFGWADAIQPYIKSTQIYQCPSETTAPQSDPKQRQYTDFWYNARLARVEGSKPSFISNVILCGDGNDGTDKTDARYHLLSLPQKWLDDTSSPAYRHLEGANYAFADGHVKRLRPKSVSDKASSNTFSFLLGGG